MAWHCPWQQGGKQVAVLEKYSIGQPPSVSLWMEGMLPSLGALPRPLGPARTDGSGHLMVSCWKLKQSKIPGADKGLEEESLEAAASGVASPGMFITNKQVMLLAFLLEIQLRQGRDELGVKQAADDQKALLHLWPQLHPV